MLGELLGIWLKNTIFDFSDRDVSINIYYWLCFMRGNILEAAVGAIVLFVAAFFLYFAYTSNGEKINDGYTVVANFDNVGSLVTGADVKISGVKVGIVKSISVDSDYTACVTLLLKSNIRIPVDSAACIATDGLIGNKFVSISIGGESDTMKNGDKFDVTKSAVNLEDLIDKIVGGFINGSNANKTTN